MSRGRHFGRLASDPNARSSHWPAVMPYTRGLQPPPQDPKKLYRECNRLAWALRCKATPRAKLAVILDRYDAQIVAMRRQHDVYLSALEALDPELHRRALEHLREMDDPLKALRWEQRMGGTDDVAT